MTNWELCLNRYDLYRNTCKYIYEQYPCDLLLVVYSKYMLGQAINSLCCELSKDVKDVGGIDKYIGKFYSMNIQDRDEMHPLNEYLEEYQDLSLFSYDPNYTPQSIKDFYGDIVMDVAVQMSY